MNIARHRLTLVAFLIAVVATTTFPSPTYASDALRIVAFGDMTTASWPRVKAYSEVLQEKLTKVHIRAVVLNAGARGLDTEQAVENLDRDLLSRHGDIVIIQLGFNDSTIRKGATEPPVSEQDYRANLQAIVERIRSTGAEPLLMTPTPLFWTDATRKKFGAASYDVEDRWGLNVQATRYAAIVREVAKATNATLVDVQQLFLERIESGSAADVEWLSDGIHPNTAGHDAIGSALARKIVPRLRSGEIAPKRTTSLPALDGSPLVTFVERGRALGVIDPFENWTTEDGSVRGPKQSTKSRPNRPLYAAHGISTGDFHMHARVSLESLDHYVSFKFGHDMLWVGGDSGVIAIAGPRFGDPARALEQCSHYLFDNIPFDFEAKRVGRKLTFSIDGWPIITVDSPDDIPTLSIESNQPGLSIEHWSVRGRTREVASLLPPAYTIPTIDLAGETHRQVTVDREKGKYLGHPTTVLLEDNKTILTVYPEGHGKGSIVYKRSRDGGLTWSERLSVPKSWSTSKETPSIHRVVDRDGKKRLIVFSGLYPARLSVSEDDGLTWSELEPVGDWGGIVVMGSLERIGDGRYMALFHDDGRFIQAGGRRTTFKVYKTISDDGGLTWSPPSVIAHHPHAHLCEPGLIRSPEGKQLAVLLRENSRQYNSFVVFSNDEGETWTEPRELPAALTGDRHTGRYAPDGRLLISFRDTTRSSPTKGDWVAWVGRYEDIVSGSEGQYRVRLMDNHVRGDCAYPGVERLPDGTFVLTTYGHWTKGEQPWIASVRLKLEELDERSGQSPR